MMFDFFSGGQSPGCPIRISDSVGVAGILKHTTVRWLIQYVRIKLDKLLHSVYTQMMVLSIALKSELFSSATQLGHTGMLLH